jgi:hypothetical protein
MAVFWLQANHVISKALQHQNHNKLASSHPKIYHHLIAAVTLSKNNKEVKGKWLVLKQPQMNTKYHLNNVAKTDYNLDKFWFYHWLFLLKQLENGRYFSLFGLFYLTGSSPSFSSGFCSFMLHFHITLSCSCFRVAIVSKNNKGFQLIIKSPIM